MPSGLVFDLLAHDKASPAFTRLAGSVDKAAVATQRFTTSELEANKVANRLKVAELEVAAATDRHAKVSASASTSIAAQARSEIALIRANEQLAGAQAASGAAAVKAARSHSLAGKAASAGAVVNRKLTLPLLALGAVSVNEATKYQKSMTLIGTVTDQTQGQMASTSKGLLNVAKDTGTGLHELGEGLYTVEKGGYRGAKALAITKAAAQGAKAENTDLATTTNALTSVMASYGDKLSDPVKAMNMMIKASGLSKTTMQDFAGSLSNVVPVAASLGIGFDQIGGAIATMTQHGESAQHATDNLRNLITNLAGQNNVASASLQQLGVNTVDLSRNLGKRGLTGSLDIVLGAINKHGKDGQIVTSSFKEAATATASVKTELESMPKAMQANARAFDSGKMSYKDYLAYSKSLGGQQYAMARQFLGTENTAKGFNRQLQSGNSNVRTLASTLQKSLGGVTGMNVALQLSGESAERFHNYVDEIGASADKTKGNVLGWANTSETLSVKLDKAKANLQVMAVEIGTALIPVVTKIVDKVSAAIHWFDSLSDTTKSVTGWSLATVAGLGLVSSALGRVGRLGSGLATFAGASETTAARVGSSMQKIGLAVGGLALAYGGTKTHGTGGAIMGALGGGITGATIGSFFGPIGTAVGAVTGAVAGLAAHFMTVGSSAQRAADAAKAALGEQKAAADDLLGTLKSVNGQYAQQTRQTTVSTLEKNGALKLAQKGHLDLGQLTDKVLTGDATSWLSNLYNSGKLKLNDGDMVKLMEDLHNVEAGSGAAEKAWQRFKAASKEGLASPKQLSDAKTLGTTLKGLGHEIQRPHSYVGFDANEHQVRKTALTNPDSAYAKRSTEVIKQYLGAARATAERNIALGQSAGKVAKGFDAQRDAIGKQLHVMGYQKSDIDYLLGTYGKMPSTLFKVTGAYKLLPKKVITNLQKTGVTDAEINKIGHKYKELPKSVRTELKKTGTSPADIVAVLAKYHLLPKKVLTALQADPAGVITKAAQAKAALAKLPPTVRTLLGVNDQVTPQLPAIQGGIDGLRGRTITVGVALKGSAKAISAVAGGISGAVGKAAKSAAGHATGGMIHGPGTGTSDDVPIWASNGEFVTREAMVRKHRGLLELINSDRLPTKLLAFAKGGAVGDVKKVRGGWAYEGKFYATEKGAKNARNRDAYETKDDKPVKAASGVYRVGKGYGFEGSYYDHAKDANAARRDARHQAAAAARYHSPEQRAAVRTDAAAYTAAAKSGDLEGTASAFRTLYEDARAAGASSKALAALSRNERTIVKDLQARAKATEQAAKVQERLSDLQSKAADLRSSVRGAFTGTFDITQASPQMFNDRAGGGSAAAILRSLTAKATKAAAYRGLLTKLGKAGLNQTMLQQLAEAGPTAEAFNAANALSKATPKELAGINSQAKRLDTAGLGAGTQIANRVFGSQISVAKALLNGYDAKKNPHMAAAVKALAKSMFGAGKVSGVGLEKGLLGQKKAAGSAAYALGAEVERSLKKSLHIKSPSRVTGAIGTNAGASLAAKLFEQRPAVAKAASALGDAAVPSVPVAPMGVPVASAPTNTTSGGGDTYIDNSETHYHLSANDPSQLLMMIERRRQRAGKP